MSGHSKWSKIKHQKQTTDAVKGKIFTKFSNAIMIAVREGGGPDPASNFKLRLVMEKARSFNMPKDNIQRAIDKAKGSNTANLMQEVVYEAFGPGGVGIIIEAVTDNKQRTVSEIKNHLEKNGGVLASIGAVSHFFKYTGIINIKKGTKTFDEIMEKALECNATDLTESEEGIEVYTAPGDLHKIKEALLSYGIPVIDSALIYKPVNLVTIADKAIAQHVLNLLSSIEELDDVHSVYANFDIPDHFMTVL